MRRYHIITTSIILTACGNAAYYPEVIPLEGPEASPPPILAYHLPPGMDAGSASDASYNCPCGEVVDVEAGTTAVSQVVPYGGGTLTVISYVPTYVCASCETDAATCAGPGTTCTTSSD